VRYIVFDSPSPEFQENGTVFEQRYNFALKNISISPSSPNLIIAPRKVIPDKKNMENYFATITSQGGEGVMLRKPLSPYEHGRSLDVLKYKAQLDGEALVQDIKGIYCFCKLPTGQTFLSRCLQTLTKNIKINSIVSYKYSYTLKKGIPSNPVIYKIRPDLTWQNIVNSS